MLCELKMLWIFTKYLSLYISFWKFTSYYFLKLRYVPGSNRCWALLKGFKATLFFQSFVSLSTYPFTNYRNMLLLWQLQSWTYWQCLGFHDMFIMYIVINSKYISTPCFQIYIYVKIKIHQNYYILLNGDFWKC